MKIVKPLDAINTIISHFPSEDLCILEEGDSVNLTQGKQSYVMLLLSGIVSYSSSHRNLVYVRAPHILGVIEASGVNCITGTITALTPCIYRLVRTRDFTCSVSKNNLWEYNSNLLSYHLAGMVLLLTSSTNKKNLIVICSLLKILDMPELDFIKSKISMCEYILLRSSLSRSTIMYTLSMLIKNRNIEARRGKLIRIIEIPEDGIV